MNQRIRITKPYKEYTLIVITVFLTWFITTFLNILVEGEDLSNLPPWGKIFYWLIVFTSIFYIIYKMVVPMSEDNLEENLLIDYKEIIDEILNKEQDFCTDPKN